MRRWIMSGLLLGLLSLGLLPATAQSGIAGVLADDSNFTLLNEMIAAADSDVTTTLNSSGYTLLAPTNDALRNLEAFLDVPLEALMQDEDIVTNLLLYHLIEGRVAAEDIRTQYDGGVVETLLDNAFVNFDVLPDGTIQINDVVEVTQADIPADGSVVHVINDVLLNRIITEAIPDELPTLPATPTAPDTPDTTGDTLSSGVRLVYAVPTEDADSVDVYLNGVLAFGDVVPQQTTELFMLDADAVEVVVTDTDAAPDDGGLVSQESVELNADAVTTLILTLPLDYELNVVTQSLAAIPTDEASVTFWNALDDASPVTLRIDRERIASDVAAATSETFSLAAGTYEVDVRDTGDDPSTAIAPQTLSVDAGQAYLLIGTASDDAAALVIADAIAAQTTDDAPVVSAPTTVPTAAPAETIADVIASRDDLQTLLDVINATNDERILSTLESDGSYTLFAPSNQAFINLLATLDMSLAGLAANPNLLSEIVRYHVLQSEQTVAQLQARDGDRLPTLLSGTSVLVYDADTTVLLNELVRVQTDDIQASNGVIHIIDNVLLPPSALNAFNED